MIKLLGTEAALGTATGTASAFGNAKTVRLVNTTTTGYLVTLEQADGTDIGTMTLMGGESVVIHKNPTDKIFAANAGVKGAAVGFSH